MRMVTVGLCLLGLASFALGQEKAVTILAGGGPAMVLSVPPGAKLVPMGEKTVVQTEAMLLHIWPVAGAKTTADAAARLAETIKGDVLKFNVTKTNEITVAGSPARHLIGNGVEADDGDAATADVVIFAVGPGVFIACVHGEANDASKEREPMLKVLRTAKSP